MDTLSLPERFRWDTTGPANGANIVVAAVAYGDTSAREDYAMTR